MISLFQEDEQVDAVATKVQTSFTVKLTAFDAAKKVPLIKEIKAAVEGMNLVQVFILDRPSPYFCNLYTQLRRSNHSNYLDWADSDTNPPLGVWCG